MWYVYILYSKRLDKYYIVITDNLKWRLERHIQGWGKFTKGGIPWELVYFEKYSTKQEVHKRERIIKRKKSRQYIEHLIST